MKFIFKYLFIIVIVGITSSCFSNKKKGQDINDYVNDSIAVIITDTLQEPLIEATSIYETPIDMNSVKKKYTEFSTSGILPISESRHLYKPKDKGYFGRYNLIEPQSQQIVGNLIIFNDDKEWQYDNQTDIFIEIKATDKGILVFDDIEVGSELSLLQSKLGKPHNSIDNTLIYRDDKLNTIALFEVKNKKISWFKVGLYNDEFYKDIDTNINKLLKQHQ